jgi:hypothetical protein
MSIKNFTNEFDIEALQFCTSKELRFYRLFDKNSEYFRFGFLIYNNGRLIGVTKCKGEKTLLSFKTDINNIPLEKFGVYQLPKKFTEFLKLIDNSKNHEWLKINIIGNLFLKNGNVFLSNFEKIIENYGNKSKDYLRDYENNINLEYKYNEFVKKFDLEVNLEEFLNGK